MLMTKPLKSVLGTVGILCCIVLLQFLTVDAAITGTVSATITAQSISITRTSDGSVAYGTVATGESQDTITLSDTETFQNNGNVDETFGVSSSGGTGGNSWYRGDTAQTDVFIHYFSTTSPSTYWALIAATSSYTTATSGVDANASPNFWFKITTPSAVSDTV